jgi:prolyl oligopeptidase
VHTQVLDDVKCELRFWRYTFPEGAATGGKWKLERTHRGAGVEQLGARASDANSGDEIWITSTSYTSPTTYARAEASAPQKAEVLKALPSFFDASGLHVQQFFATSTDGTKVPYFLVSKKAMKLDGSTPTLLYGYGGFEISLTPQYIATVGVGWLEQGGAYVQANIRGGGEYGPQWHQAALKEKRHKAYEDFEAVAKDLVARGVTSAARLGCHGGSNGGLLTGNMLVRSPELFGAIVCQVPLLDMRRFNKLLAGASWMGEYGDPDDPKQWEFVQKYSPYHRLGRGVTYPPILFTTSTRDDRVHPGHARKMVKKMSELQAASVYYYENVEGGHGGAADNKQRAFMSTLIYSFLAKTLRDGEIQPAASATKVPLRARIDPRAVTMAAGAVLLGWLAVVERGRR